MKTMRDLINTVQQLNEAWWPSKAKPAAAGAQEPGIKIQDRAVKRDDYGYLRWLDNGKKLEPAEIAKLNQSTKTAAPAPAKATAADPHVSQVVSQLQKLAYKLKANPNSSDAREQVAHYVWGLKKTAAKYGAEQWLPHLAAIEKNTGDVAAINKFVTDYNAANK